MNVLLLHFKPCLIHLDADKVENLYSYLLNPEYIAVQRKEDKTPIRLTEDIIDEIFTGQDFDFVLPDGKNRQINYLDFSKLCGLPIGFRENAEQIKHKNYGKFSERFQPLVFIYRAVKSGMVSMGEVNRGEVTLVDLVEINHLFGCTGRCSIFQHGRNKAEKTGGIDECKRISHCFKIQNRFGKFEIC